MILRWKRNIRIFIVIFFLTLVEITYMIFQQAILIREQRKQFIHNFYDENLYNESYVDILEKKLTERKINRRSILRIKEKIKKINLEQKVHNVKYFQAFNITRIIVIQVHSNLFLLQQLLEILRNAYLIHEALLIFSHDTFNNKINTAVADINFARYMQIFYPYSIQLHPSVFPGADKTCDDIKICNELEKRNPKAAQAKHHWWWQVNQVFDNLEVTTNFNGSILFIEEGNLLTEDFMMLYKILDNVKQKNCPLCHMLSLGAHKPNKILYNKKKAIVSLEVLKEDTPTIGIAFDRNTWRLIKDWKKDFCYFNDYSWGNSLKYVGMQHWDVNFRLVAINGPRVFNVGSCKNDVDCKTRVDLLKLFMQSVKNDLFPFYFEIKVGNAKEYFVQPLGNFSDVRDHELCMYFTKNCVWY